jgi:hypothetical protein
VKFHLLGSSIIVCISFMTLSQGPYAAETTLIRFAWQQDDQRYDDLYHILNRAMTLTEQAYGPYQLERITLPMSETRQFESIKKGKRLDLIWTSTSTKKEQELLPIRIPLRQGLLGYRLLIVNESTLEKWKQVNTLAQLQQKVMVQGVGWGDIALYEHSHIKVIPLRYEMAFKAVHLGKVDAFPRSLSEIFNEVEKYGREFSYLRAEPTLLLYYPWPYYFFVNKENTILYSRLIQGLEQMVNSGELRNITISFNSEAIRKANLGSRRVIYLENPFLPEATPLDRKDYWYKIQ